ncbi:hypothetical protein SAMN05216218_106204 [Halorientalis regularis]|jgi:hypothetical protein|uniref:Uncharacterized protein n=1 Tax=Halorientalis regularis TaxID=660518 RepID=A0A1G7L8T6_9EURY|nr:hypothetical protein SAMN05216218_106204 [Halorientalis regularis]
MHACQLNAGILKLKNGVERGLSPKLTARIHGLKTVVLRLLSL